jgi:hypothetical protein
MSLPFSVEETGQWSHDHTEIPDEFAEEVG